MTTVQRPVPVGDLVSPAQYGDDLRVLLVGPGAETRGDQSYESLRRTIEQRGAWCQSFDFAKAGALSPTQSAEEQWTWLMRNYVPEYVVAPKGLPEGVRVPEDCQVVSQASEIPSKTLRVKKDGPAVTLFVPYYNTAQFLDEQMQATLDQSYGDFEMVYLDDGCVDESRSVLAKYESDPRLRIVRQENVGQSRRFDVLFSQVDPMLRGEYLAFLGADDVSEPTRFERQVQTLEAYPEAALVHSAASILDGESKRIGNGFSLKYGYNQYSLLGILLRVNVIGNPSVMMRTSALREVGGWRGGLACDYELWLELARRRKPFLYLPEKLVRYRMHGGNVSFDADGFLDAFLAELSSSIERELVERTSLPDLYPGLQSAQASAKDFAAAHVDLWLTAWRTRQDFQLAEQHYEEALNLAPEFAPMLAWNRAIFFSLHHDAESAEFWRHQALQLGSVDARKALPLEAEHLVLPEALSSKLFQLPAELEPSAVSWNGSTATHRRIMVVVDWSDGLLLHQLLQTWCEMTRATDALDLVFPRVGASSAHCLEAFAQAAAGLDLGSAGPVILEDWAELWALPADYFVAQIASSSSGSMRSQLEGAIRSSCTDGSSEPASHL